MLKLVYYFENLHFNATLFVMFFNTYRFKDDILESLERAVLDTLVVSTYQYGLLEAKYPLAAI